MYRVRINRYLHIQRHICKTEAISIQINNYKRYQKGDQIPINRHKQNTHVIFIFTKKRMIYIFNVKISKQMRSQRESYVLVRSYDMCLLPTNNTYITSMPHLFVFVMFMTILRLHLPAYPAY